MHCHCWQALETKREPPEITRLFTSRKGVRRTRGHIGTVSSRTTRLRPAMDRVYFLILKDIYIYIFTCMWSAKVKKPTLKYASKCAFVYSQGGKVKLYRVKSRVAATKMTPDKSKWQSALVLFFNFSLLLSNKNRQHILTVDLLKCAFSHRSSFGDLFTPETHHSPNLFLLLLLNFLHQLFLLLLGEATTHPWGEREDAY